MASSRRSIIRASQRKPAAAIDRAIRRIRGERVILDSDLASIYGVETRTLNQAIKRNRDKFPPDFLFQLNRSETAAVMRSQVVIASPNGRSSMRSQSVIASRRNVRHLPYAFTEHGAIMAANVLNSAEAVQMSVFVVRAFIKMRAVLTDTRDLARKLATLERELKTRLDTHETAITDVLRHIMKLLDPPEPPEPPHREMGFHSSLKTLANKP